MSFKKALYVLLVMVVAAFSGVAGAAAGGVAVYRAVRQGQPASGAGLQQGDIITKIGSTALDGSHSYLNTLYAYDPGNQISVTFIRNGAEKQVTVMLGEATRN